MKRLTVMLEPDEKEALLVLAQQERRDPSDQAAWVIRQALEERGLIASQAVELSEVKQSCRADDGG